MFSSCPYLGEKIYEDIKETYRDDGHYWLQYGSFELEYGTNIDLAENFLGQAEALMPNSVQVVTATAHLLLKKSIAAQSEVIARGFRDEALRILRAQFADSKQVGLHALHIFGSQQISYIKRWIEPGSRAARFRDVHDELRRSIPVNLKSHPELTRLIADLKREELMMVIK